MAGTWRYDKGKIILSAFRRLTKDERSEAQAEADRLAELHR